MLREKFGGLDAEAERQVLDLASQFYSMAVVESLTDDRP